MSTTSGHIVVSESTFFRDDSGRFLSKVDAGATAAVKEIAETIANLAKAFAPFRTGELKKSIIARMMGAHEAFAIATAPHAAVQEFGGSPHTIGEEGQRLINRGEGLYPGWSGWGVVEHPGNPATHFMRNAGQVVAALSQGIVEKHMPGGG
jgi:uncharacterized protein YukE